jgi:membrane protease subunit HflK
MIIGIILVAVLIVGKTCFYIVAPAEQAVIKRFGQVIAVTGAGPHFKLPFPIETAAFAKVTEVHRMAIGYLESGYENRDGFRSADPLMLTGDENIVSIDFIIQYQINDIVDFLFNLQDVENTIRLASEASIREIAGKAAIDDLLTIGKEQVQEETKTLIQSILDDYKAGVQIVAVELQDIEPPANVMSAFQDVASAREDKNKFINEAEAYANQKIPMARAEAATIMLEAESYKARVLANAIGEASRFSQVYESYKKTPDITRRRMYLEAMVNIMQKSEIVVVDDSIKAVNLFSGFDIIKQGVEAK